MLCPVALANWEAATREIIWVQESKNKPGQKAGEVKAIILAALQSMSLYCNKNVCSMADND